MNIKDPFARAIVGLSFAEPAPDKPQPAAMLEDNEQKKNDKPKCGEKAMLEAVEERAAGDSRNLAASMISVWIKDGDPEADDFDALAVSMAGLSDLDEDAEVTEEQEDAYNDALSSLADAAVALGADQDDVTEMIDDDDDAAAERVYDAISENIGDDDEMLESAITVYTVAGGNTAMLESTQKVVRGGKVKVIKKRLRPRRMTSLQKQALKKARTKAHSSIANTNRKKSMKIRARRGM